MRKGVGGSNWIRKIDLMRVLMRLMIVLVSGFWYNRMDRVSQKSNYTFIILYRSLEYYMSEADMDIERLRNFHILYA